MYVYLQNTCSNVTQFLYMLGYVWSSDGDAICYVLPVQCAMSCVHIMEHEIVHTDDVTFGRTRQVAASLGGLLRGRSLLSSNALLLLLYRACIMLLTAVYITETSAYRLCTNNRPTIFKIILHDVRCKHASVLQALTTIYCIR